MDPEGEEEEGNKSERVCLERACLSQLDRNIKTARLSWVNKKQTSRIPGILLDRQSGPLATGCCWIGWLLYAYCSIRCGPCTACLQLYLYSSS